LVRATLFVALTWHSTAVYTQAATPEMPSLLVLAARNPTLAEILRVAPEYAPAVRDQLGPLEFPPLSVSTVQGGRRGSSPTPSEAEQLARNPDFAVAYARYPDETLGLLRQINGIVAATGGHGAGR
jgi:hypothetical protein